MGNTAAGRECQKPFPGTSGSGGCGGADGGGMLAGKLVGFDGKAKFSAVKPKPPLGLKPTGGSKDINAIGTGGAGKGVDDKTLLANLSPNPTKPPKKSPSWRRPAVFVIGSILGLALLAVRHHQLDRYESAVMMQHQGEVSTGGEKNKKRQD